ncbi:site-specific DNA-methyltransferase [Orbaceae bacterium ESL0721]|nr:site-specific DNA-methyltransferase [Orbaceae bacterium ESL0721]
MPFEKNSVNLLHGDCLNLMQEIPDKSIDMVLCDMPYGTTRCKWDSILDLDAVWLQLNRIVKENAAVALFGAEPFSSILRCSNLQNFKYDWIWDKIKGTGFLNAKKQPMRNHEIISVFYKKQPIYNPQKTKNHKLKKSFRTSKHQTEIYGHMKNDYMYTSTERYPRSIQPFSSDIQNSSLHPTQKPVALCEYLIKTYTDENQTVLDFTMGSGTTCIACINENRRFIGIEKDDRYFDIAKERVEKHLKQIKRIKEEESQY